MLWNRYRLIKLEKVIERLIAIIILLLVIVYLFLYIDNYNYKDIGSRIYVIQLPQIEEKMKAKMKGKVMSEQSPRYAYAITLGFGILAFIISIKLTSIEMSLFQSILRHVAIYLFFGIVVGLLWPMVAWKWGLWLSIPIVFLIGLSVLFAGNVVIFLQKDLPVLTAIVTSGSIGGLLGSRLRGKSHRMQNSDNGNSNK